MRVPTVTPPEAPETPGRMVGGAVGANRTAGGGTLVPASIRLSDIAQLVSRGVCQSRVAAWRWRRARGCHVWHRRSVCAGGVHKNKRGRGARGEGDAAEALRRCLRGRAATPVAGEELDGRVVETHQVMSRRNRRVHPAPQPPHRVVGTAEERAGSGRHAAPLDGVEQHGEASAGCSADLARISRERDPGSDGEFVWGESGRSSGLRRRWMSVIGAPPPSGHARSCFLLHANRRPRLSP